MSKTIDAFAGAVAEGMNDQDRALSAFENALRHNPSSVLGLNAVASIARGRDDFDKAIEYFQRILNANPENGEVWGSMGSIRATNLYRSISPMLITSQGTVF